MLKPILICAIATVIYLSLIAYFTWDYRRQTTAQAKEECHVGATIISFSLLYLSAIITVIRLTGEGLFNLL